MIVSENMERREVVETGLVAVEQACSDLQESQAKLTSAIELQEQYSRKTTLLLSGRAIPSFREDEHTRRVVVTLLKDFLGMEIHPRAITACHRLRSKSVILVRFADLDERMAVYRQRLSPIKKGLLVHESLTNERLAVIKILQRLHKPKETSPFQSYYTSVGRIFIRLANVPKAIELSVGTTEKDILDICQKHTRRHPPTGSVLSQAPARKSSAVPATRKPHLHATGQTAQSAPSGSTAAGTAGQASSSGATAATGQNHRAGSSGAAVVDGRNHRALAGQVKDGTAQATDEVHTSECCTAGPMVRPDSRTESATDSPIVAIAAPAAMHSPPGEAEDPQDTSVATDVDHAAIAAVGGAGSSPSV